MWIPETIGSQAVEVCCKECAIALGEAKADIVTAADPGQA